MAEPTQIPVPPGVPPLVFLGPSAPGSDVAELLPQAEIRPPARRGDLHLARLMRHSVLLLVDGVFTQQDAVSPREVVDVLRDGAAVIGAASMGALRAADCAPAGAEGAGRIFRLFRAGAIGSEDEVAVQFIPERPYPSMSESLINIRLALRTGVRNGWLDAATARRMERGAQTIPYADRTWTAVFEAAGIGPDDWLRSKLAALDAKRTDTRLALAQVAARIEADPAWGLRPRLSRQVFGILSHGRELPPDPALVATDEAGLLWWMLVSGRANAYLGPERTAADVAGCLGLKAPSHCGPSDGHAWSDLVDDPPEARSLLAQLDLSMRGSGNREAERYRWLAVMTAAREADRLGVAAGAVETRHAEAELAIGHNARNWRDLQNDLAANTLGAILAARDVWARAKAVRRILSVDRVRA